MVKVACLSLISLAGVILTGCSVYQSEGREFLEDQAFEFALQGASLTAVKVMEPCAHVLDASDDFIEAHWLSVDLDLETSLELWRLKAPMPAQSLLLLYRLGDESKILCEIPRPGASPDGPSAPKTRELFDEFSPLVERLLPNSGNL